MTKKEKKETIAKIVDELKKLYPVALCSLNYEGEGWKLLVMGRLSAQCTDERVNIVCKELFKRFPTAKDLADGNLTEIENIIKSCGLYKMKAKNIKSECQRLVYECNGIIPDTMDELLKFEGVGRKIANLILGDLYNKPAIVADTHCMRICGRLGMYKEGQKDPLKTEKIMSELIEPSEQSDFCHRMVLFGREYCSAKNPKCNICPIKSLCKKQNGKDKQIDLQLKNNMIELIKLPKERYKEAIDLIWHVFQIYEVPDFPPEGVIEYKRILDETEKLKNIIFYTAMENDKVIGVLGMRENNHIGYFYVKETHHRRGIGKLLYEAICKDYNGDITVNACPYGVPVYKKLGFEATDIQQNKNGVIYTPMIRRRQ